MLPGSRLPHPKLRVLSAAPMDREHDVAHLVVDIDNDVSDQRPKKLLARVLSAPEGLWYRRQAPTGCEVMRPLRLHRRDGLAHGSKVQETTMRN